MEIAPNTSFDPSSQIGSCTLSDGLCSFLSYDFWTIINVGWALLQSLWVLIVVITQMGQIFINYTTNEAINYHRFDYLIHPDDLSAPTYRKRYINPFDMGPIGNCIDFWSKGSGPLKDISWFNIYDTPSYLSRKKYTKVLADDPEALPLEDDINN
jgi:hypothetical protein